MKNIKPARRALYKYTCSVCGKIRSSLVYGRAKNKICTKCRGEEINENQSNIYDNIK